MRRISDSIGGAGVLVKFSSQDSQSQSRIDTKSWLYDTLEKFDPCIDAGKFLPSQSGLCLRELAGASRRVSRGPSLGDSTSAGAENSQVTLHADHANLDDGILSFTQSGMGFYPAFSLHPGIKHDS